jgi:hypothetical protein
MEKQVCLVPEAYKNTPSGCQPQNWPMTSQVDQPHKATEPGAADALGKVFEMEFAMEAALPF